jgi:plastocyanin
MRALLIAAFLVAAALAGCASTDTTTTSGTSTTSPTTTAPPPMMNHTVEDVTVNIQGNAFAPANVTVMVGATVSWVNKDTGVVHNVVADDGSFGSGDCPGQGCLLAGTSIIGRDAYEHKFETAGAFPYHCGVHPGMTGVVNVQEMMM